MATRRRASRNSITGTITDLQRRIRHLQTLPAPSRLANEVVRRVNIQPRAVDSDQLALRAVVNDSIEDAAIRLRNMDTNSVNTSQIIDNAITRLKILDGEVVDGKLGGGSVNRDNVKDSAINANKLANASVEEDKIVNGAVTNSKIGTGAVRTSNIQGSAVTTSTIADLNVTTSKLATGAVTSAKIGSGQVDTTQLANGAVTTAKIFNTSLVVASGLAAGTGLLKTSAGNGLSADFGYGSTQIPRGNHIHLAVVGSSNSNVTVLAASVARSNHIHGVTITRGETPASSLRYKKDITDYSVEDPKKVLELQLKKYKYKNLYREAHTESGKPWLYGYVAEEVDTLGLTEIVAYDTEGKPDAIHYSRLSLLLLELAKEQQKEIDVLKKEIKILGEKND